MAILYQGRLMEWEDYEREILMNEDTEQMIRDQGFDPDKVKVRGSAEREAYLSRNLDDTTSVYWRTLGQAVLDNTASTLGLDPNSPGLVDKVASLLKLGAIIFGIYVVYRFSK